MLESNKYIKGLDGLRGLAVLMVMFYHFSHINSVSHNSVDKIFSTILRIGWIGVDIFFVLSGFLITRILIWSKGSSIKQYLKVFYIKRSLRIFPLYFLYLIFIFAIFYPYITSHVGLIEQQKIKSAQDSILWFFLYLSNIKQTINGTFFGAGLGHLWSLSIEEQFYIVWPFVIYFVKKENYKTLFSSLIVITLALRIGMYLYGVNGEIIYVFTLTRIDGLIFGAYIAVLTMENKPLAIDNKSIRNIFYILLIGCLATIGILGPRVEMHPIIYTLILSLLGLSFSLLIWLLNSKEPSSINKFFSSRFLVYFGKYSYGLYMFHPLIRQFIMKVIGSPKLILGSEIIWEIGVMIICTIASLIVALLSWNLFEKWFLKSKDFFLKKPLESSAIDS